MRDQRLTGYTPIPTQGVTAEQRVAVTTRAVPCDGEVAGPGLGHPRIWMRIADREVTCPYCSITYMLAEGTGDEHAH